MNLTDLPPSHHVRTLSVDRLLRFAESISAQRCTYNVLTGDLDELDYSLVATKLSSLPDESVRASIAWKQHQLEGAARLVRERYLWRGYLTPEADGLRPLEDRAALTLIAETAGTTVGTMSLGLDGPGGLSVDESYPEPLSAARSNGGRLCELTRLALAAEADTRAVLSVMFGLAYALASALQDVTDVFIEVNPRHVVFYRRVLGFVVAAGERVCERVQAPAVLLRTSMDELELRLRAYCNLPASDRPSPPPSQTAFA